MMENKPIVTCHGDQELFSSFHADLRKRLEKEPVEWRRSYGRPPRKVKIEVNFVPFSPEILPKESSRFLLRQPFFHIYWTDCSDLDIYRFEVKDEIGNWLQALRQYNIQDWFIVLVDMANTKRGGAKTKLLPRSSVIDKIKNDYCSKQSDRCILLYEPVSGTSSSKTSESWQNFLARLRQLILTSYNRNLGKFEDTMRAEREKRTENNWDFFSYFLLQEELAFTYEMLQQLDDALVQYDELDAMFSQFVLNSQAGESAGWLVGSRLSGECSHWDGPNLSRPFNANKRQLIKNGQCSLLDLRNYMFSRQCALLFFLKKPWEVAQRSLDFMHNTVHELDILEVKIPRGGVACWVFLSCIEVLQTCEKCSNTSQRETYSHYTATLWAYAQSKLQELGELCRLMPGMEAPSSLQLHCVVDLLAGMDAATDDSEHSIHNSPHQKIHEALSSRQAFEKHYLELSELAMGTYKHIGRLRSARKIGRDLATFYIKKENYQKAETFLLDSLKAFTAEGWHLLAASTSKQIAHCQKLLNANTKYLKTCGAILSRNNLISQEEQQIYLQEFIKTLQEMSSKNIEDSAAVLVNMEGMIQLERLELRPQRVATGQTLTLDLTLYSRLPQSIDCRQLSASLLRRPCDHHQEETRTDPAKGMVGGVSSLAEFDVDLSHDFEYTADGSQLSWAGVVCRNAQAVLRRQDSSSSIRLHSPADSLLKEDFSTAFARDNITIEPGANPFVLTLMATKPGEYTLRQLCVQTGNVHLLLSKIVPEHSCTVVKEQSEIKLKLPEDQLLAGITQKCVLWFSNGEFALKEDVTITIDLPSNSNLHLEVKGDENQCVIQKRVPGHPHSITLLARALADKTEVDIPLHFLAEIPQHNSFFLEESSHNETSLQFTVNISSSTGASLSRRLSFFFLFSMQYYLRTALDRKFIQIEISNVLSSELLLSEPRLQISSEEATTCSLSPLHQPSAPLTLPKNLPTSYVWSLSDWNQNNLFFNFSLSYQQPDNSCLHTVNYSFHLSDFETQYTISSNIKPREEACRTGQWCVLEINIARHGKDKKEVEVEAEAANGRSPSPPPDPLPVYYQLVYSSSLWKVHSPSIGAVTQAHQEVMVEVMPLVTGDLPVPTVKLFKHKALSSADIQKNGSNDDIPNWCEDNMERFNQGQVYDSNSALQIHVLPADSSLSK